jgi:hypothetical protein
MTKRITWLALALILLSCNSYLSANPFTPGDLVVYRVGDGATYAAGAATYIYLDEYTTAGAWVQSILVPATGGDQMTASIDATSEGFLTLSADGSHVMFTGYRAAVGKSSLSGTTAAKYPRAVASIDASGNIVTRTLTSGDFDQNNIRSAASTNGTDVWVAGAGSGTSGGVYYLSMSGSGETHLSSTYNNARQVEIFNNQLYATSNKITGNYGVSSIGTGLPTTPGQTATLLPGLSSTTNAGSFSFFMCDLNPSIPGNDTLYIADDDATTGGIQKWCFNGSTWVAEGTVGDKTKGYRGLTGSVSGSTVTLYITRSGGSTPTGGGELATMVDSTGYNGYISGSGWFTQIAGAATNEAFRGVAFVPVPEPSTLALLVAGMTFGIIPLCRWATRRNRTPTC